MIVTDTDKLLEKALVAVPKIMRASAKAGALIKPAPKLEKGVYDCVNEAKSDCFTVGFGKVSLVPEDIFEKTYYMAGYGPNNPIKTVQDPTYARAVWLDDNSGRGGIALIAVDCIGLLNFDVNKVKELLGDFKRISGCRAINIMSTHDHAGIDTMGLWGKLPRTGRNKRYMREVVYKGIVTAVKLAYGDRREGDLMLGRTIGEGIQHDIRLPEVFSKVITRARFVPRDGKRCIHLINFAAHAETMDFHNSQMSADWPGFLCRKIFSETRGDETVFFNGAIGGMITPVEKGKNNVETTIIAGESVAEAALSIGDEEKLSPRISILRQEFYVPIYNTVLAAAGLLRIVPSKRYCTGEGALGLSLKTEMNYLDIGGKLQILMLPGELFPELAYGGYLPEEQAGNGSPDKNPKTLTEIAENPDLVIFGLANDEIGYILPPNDYCLNLKKPFLEDYYEESGRKHYEETNSTGIETAGRIADTFTGMMETVKGKSHTP